MISETAAVLNLGKITSQKSIFVCTFCQVFSTSDSSIVDHINSQHQDSLLTGTTAENFVSKLQALPNDNNKTGTRKVGRPRKKPIEKKPTKKEPDPEPLPGPDGLYWCKKCVKCFKKSRQLTRHVCLDIEEGELLNDSAEESDNSDEFKTHMDIDPVPWKRRPKHVKKENIFVHADQEITKDEEEPFCKVILNWREDPSYVPLFGNDSERHAFEKHLKSIDYSCVDNLFVKEERKVKGKRKRNSFNSCGFIYSCIICQKEQNSLTHIRMHCLTHTEVKPFTCPKCPYRSNTKGSLYSHMRNHTGNVFRCSKCSFQSTKRAHLLEHEDTHSSIPQWCKLCKNPYKNLRSLIAHVKKYHSNPGGKKYVKFLSSKNPKEIPIKCQNCFHKFTSQLDLDLHIQKMHCATTTTASVEENNKDINPQESTPENTHINESSLLPIPASNLDCQNEILAIKDPLAEIVLNNILQQKTTENIELFEDVFQQSTGLASTESQNENFSPGSTPSGLPAVANTSQFNPSETELEECGKTLSLEILDECLRYPKFAEEVISEACIPKKLQNETFDMPEIPLSFQNESLMVPDIQKADENIPQELSELNENLAYKSSLNETKPDEIKLFEKCRRAPAYVCCVCSGIFICSSTLKAHLREHINTTSSLIEEAAAEDLEKMVERDADLEAILQDPANSCSDDERELEKLFSSSLDMVWYLPEVSVVLENDPALFDSMLEDMSNFPISDKFDETEEMNVKCPEMEYSL